MKYFHLTILRYFTDGCRYDTIYKATRSMEKFLVDEGKAGRITHVLYSRELTKEEYKKAKSLAYESERKVNIKADQ